MRTRSQVTNVDVARVLPWRDGRESSRLTRPNTHDTTERLVGNANILAKFAVVSNFVVMYIRLRKVLGQQTKSGNDGIPAPSLVLDTDNIDHQSVAGFRSFHIHWTGKRVNKLEIQPADHLRCAARCDLSG